jgi:hypothetical protein
MISPKTTRAAPDVPSYISSPFFPIIATNMISAITRSRPLASAISRVVLVVLFVWFAAPEAQSYTPHFDPTLVHGIEQLVVQFEITKEGSADILTRQVSNPIVVICSTPSLAGPIVLGPAFLEVNAFTRNAFYVLPSINAP